MPSPSESRAILAALSNQAVATSQRLITRLSGTPEYRRDALLEAIPELIGYYSDGSGALAVDFYEEQRDDAGVTSPFVPTLVVPDRESNIRRGTVWAAAPLFDGDELGAGKRLAEIIQLETARPYRDTILANTRNDPAAVGWKRITNQCCSFCRMLADRGAVYKESTARFAAHPHCDCTAAPVFIGGKVGPEASTLQYRASRRSRTPKQREELRNYLAENYG